MLIIGSSFEADDPAFGGATPASYYIAAYIGVVLAAVGLVMLPVHLASYRRRRDSPPLPGVAFRAVGTSRGMDAVATVLAVAAIATLLVTVQFVFGVPAVDDLRAPFWRSVLGSGPRSTSASRFGLALPPPARPKVSDWRCSSRRSCSVAQARPRRCSLR